ncbi:DUF962 domain-containing protein [Hymenobacter oligotrophus]|uniref:DUF962 domain-containing protein n=1 Tax=Hymenobacter oligotrophus TaxID=2319843 RepID=A0A3B7RE56_9BACT|nr:DUF962 domain-containing protein [Hymenobacter oligotrophus]AYA37516.1 DUF962 domain-containing protein [Hymenobacter oligotrophus]
MPHDLPAQPTFAEFYPYYLREHRQRGTRVLHFVGTSLFLLMAGAALVLLRPGLLLAGVVLAYGFAWVGHFFVERNRPATFRYPLLSLRGDFRLYWDLLRGRERFGSAEAP